MQTPTAWWFVKGCSAVWLFKPRFTHAKTTKTYHYILHLFGELPVTVESANILKPAKPPGLKPASPKAGQINFGHVGQPPRISEHRQASLTKASCAVASCLCFTVCWRDFVSDDIIYHCNQAHWLHDTPCCKSVLFRGIVALDAAQHRLDICWAYALLGDSNFLPDAEAGSR